MGGVGVGVGVALPIALTAVCAVGGQFEVLYHMSSPSGCGPTQCVLATEEWTYNTLITYTGVSSCPD